MKLFDTLIRALISALYPSACMTCGRIDRLAEPGPGVQGLRSWDAVPLCSVCRDELLSALPVRRTEVGMPPFHAGARTSAGVLELVAAWKYHGIRGLAWPLAELAAPALPVACEKAGEVSALIPVPLHSRRRRRRGFNQAELLARLLAERWNIPVLNSILERRKSTSQQASLSSKGAGRQANVSGAFAAREAEGPAPAVGLIDDVVTSGATVSAAVAALEAKGWNVAWVLSICLSDRPT